MELKTKTCTQCDQEYQTWDNNVYRNFCSERCAMDKYGYTPEDFIPTDHTHREPE